MGHVVNLIQDKKISEAALRVLRDQGLETHFTDHGLAFDASILEQVRFGPFESHGLADEHGEQHENPNDFARILYWWGNSNLYWPVTEEEWVKSLSRTSP